MNQHAEQIELTAERRMLLGKQVKQLRRQGWLPAVMYGHGFDPVPLQFEAKSLSRALAQISGSQLVSIRISGQSQPEMALVRDVQRDPITGMPLHVDFYRVSLTERIRAEIPLTLVKKSPVVERNAGILLHGISSIEVECLPSDLVDTIEVDLSTLVEVDQEIAVRDLPIPAGIEVLTDPDEMVVRVVPVKEVVEVEEAAPAAAEVEVISKGKVEKEAGETEE